MRILSNPHRVGQICPTFLMRYLDVASTFNDRKNMPWGPWMEKWTFLNKYIPSFMYKKHMKWYFLSKSNVYKIECFENRMFGKSNVLIFGFCFGSVFVSTSACQFVLHLYFVHYRWKKYFWCYPLYRATYIQEFRFLNFIL